MDLDSESGSESESSDDSDDEEIKSACVAISPLSARITEVHLMNLVESASFELADPSRLLLTQKLKNNTCHLEFQSADSANAFMAKFHKFKIENNDGNALNVKKIVNYSKIKWGQQYCNSSWIRVSNLVHSISGKQLTKHITKTCKVSPKFVDIYKHSESDYPSYACVQMRTAEDAQRVMKTLKMTDFQGQKVWVKHMREIKRDRRAHLKGSVKIVGIHFPSGNTKEDISKMCAAHGKVVEIWIQGKKAGHQSVTKFGKVEMSNVKEAAAVFDALNGKKVGDGAIRTFLNDTWKTVHNDFKGKKQRRKKNVMQRRKNKEASKVTAADLKVINKKVANVKLDGAGKKGGVEKISGESKKLKSKKVKISKKKTK